jgi:anti-sigma B factor antagonist
MELSTRDDGRVSIVSLEGDLTIGPAEAAFKREIARLLEAGRTEILIDCQSLGMVDSTGLGALVRALTLSQKEGGQTKLFRPGEHLVKLLQMTQLDSVFEIFDDLESAVGSF